MKLFDIIIIFIIGVVVGYFVLSGFDIVPQENKVVLMEGKANISYDDNISLLPKREPHMSQAGVPSPCNHLRTKDIEAYSNKMIIKHDNMIYGRIGDSGSMEPLMNQWTHSIEYKPSNESEICQGDIIVFHKDTHDVIHRAIIVGYDKDGWFAITKGDNNDIGDGKIRWHQVKSVVIGLLY